MTLGALVKVAALPGVVALLSIGGSLYKIKDLEARVEGLETETNKLGKGETSARIGVEMNRQLIHSNGEMLKEIRQDIKQIIREKR